MALRLHYVVVLVLFLIEYGISQDDIDLTKGASFIFGDSLVDAGNNNYLQTLSKADITPNGIDFKASGGNPTGRYTNGRTIGDIVGEELGEPRYALPFLAPNTTGRAILYGVNYASGGGGILNATGSIFVRFATPSKACCGDGGQYAGVIPCGPTSTMCSDRDKHVFWDPYHPSEAANLLIAKELLDGDQRYISPINLRQLRDL
ncbi:hypothetical protein SASPL_117560 [Salvia splendens]|uniref:GDSL esterase/lipase n=1 Tax=Salvia splendens TaxID=180675 RepID=A0A8X8XVQ6_SALSN|nr:hypothetical protein SASPL_117560 [Salvia splendens]